MAKGNLSACLPITLAYEGGYSDHPKDPGGATNMGITIGRLSEVRGHQVTKADVKALTKTEAQSIYDRYYWRPIRGDDLTYGVDLAVFDFGVNSGPARAAKYLQAVVGVAQDGKIGDATLRAANTGDGKSIIKKLCAKRLSFMQGLAIWQTFKGGWSRRVADVEAKAVAMWLSHGGALTSTARKSLEAEANKAGKTAKSQTTAGATVGAGGGGSVIASGPDWTLIAVLGGLVVVAVVVLLLKARQNNDRALAYAAVAAAA